MNYSSQHEQYLHLKTITLTAHYLPPPASFALQNWRIFENFFRPLCSTTGVKQNSDDITKHNIAAAKLYFILFFFPVLKLKYSQEFFTHIFKDYDNRFRVYEAIISVRKGRKCLMLIYKRNKTQHNNQHLKVFSSFSKWSNYKTGLDNFCHSNTTCSMLQWTAEYSTFWFTWTIPTDWWWQRSEPMGIISMRRWSWCGGRVWAEMRWWWRSVLPKPIWWIITRGWGSIGSAWRWWCGWWMVIWRKWTSSTWWRWGVMMGRRWRHSTYRRWSSVTWK